MAKQHTRRYRLEDFEREAYRVTRAWEWQRRHTRHVWFHAWLAAEVALAVFGMLSGLVQLTVVAWAGSVLILALGLGVRRLNGRWERRFCASPQRIRDLEIELGLARLEPEVTPKAGQKAGQKVATVAPRPELVKYCRRGRYHSWATQRSVASGLYQQCERCPARRYAPYSGYYAQPLDHQWLAGGDWEPTWKHSERTVAFDRWVYFKRGVS